jgi:short-subunit dehydrogenase
VLVDLTQSESTSHLFEASLEHFGHIDVLVNNAGWGPSRRSLTKTSDADIERIIDLNLRAPIKLSRLVLQHMAARGSGTIVNIASVAGLTAPPGEAVYGAVKAGLIAFSRACFEQYRATGVRISVVIPGLVDTTLIPANKKLDRSVMLSPEEVARAVRGIIETESSACPLEVRIEPSRNPEQSR